MFRLALREDVYLALLEERHAAELFDVIERERSYLRQWLPWVDLTTEVEHTVHFIKTSLEQFANNEGFAAGIWWGSDIIGVLGTHKTDWLNRKVEIGYWIATAFQGQGIITDACRAAINHAFCEWKLNRVEIHCAVGNEKSCAIPKRLGFQFEGLLREAQLVNGKYLDINIYGMLKRDWEKLKGGFR